MRSTTRHSNRHRASILAAMLLALAAHSAAAQRDSARIVGATVRTHYCAGNDIMRSEYLEGILVSVDTNVVRVQTDEPHNLSMDRTISLERRTRESRSVLGAFIGAPLGLILGGLVLKPSEAELRASDGLARTLSLGRILGPFVGAFAGSFLMNARWEPVPLPARAGSGCAVANVGSPAAAP